MNSRRIAARAIASIALIGSCGTDARDIVPESAPNLDAVGAAMGSLDYDPAFSPEELIDLRKETAHMELDIEVIAIGAVEEIVQGRDIREVTDRSEPYHYLVMRVRVSEVCSPTTR